MGDGQPHNRGFDDKYDMDNIINIYLQVEAEKYEIAQLETNDVKELEKMREAILKDFKEITVGKILSKLNVEMAGKKRRKRAVRSHKKRQFPRRKTYKRRKSKKSKRAVRSHKKRQFPRRKTKKRK
jgi:hypothetical protein